MTDLSAICKTLRHHILQATTAAGSGHPTSCLSATELMATLMFGGYFHAKLDDPQYHNNDRLIFSKGHAAPLLYSLYTVAGAVSYEELRTLRKPGSRLEGHPTMEWPYTEAATGSLGQGLSVGIGFCLSAKLDNLPFKTFVLLGDSELAEGSNWEAIQLASHYKLNNLIAILDVNRLGQRGETMVGHDIETYEKRFASFDWHTIVVQNGHDIQEISHAYELALLVTDKPIIIIAKTHKGHGISFLQDQEGWHGKVLTQEQLTTALNELGEVDSELQASFSLPEEIPLPLFQESEPSPITLDSTKPMSTRKAYGLALQSLAAIPNVVVLDAETSNSTFAADFKSVAPERFFEMYIAEQAMVGVATGLSLRGKWPYVSTFGAFFSRAFDQIRMAQYSRANIIFVGSHAGVAIGEDGSSQMALEDLAMFGSIRDSRIFYPADAFSTIKALQWTARYGGIWYIRTTRGDTPMLYQESSLSHEPEASPLMVHPQSDLLIPTRVHSTGSVTVRSSDHDQYTILTAGITLHEALKAYELLQKEGVTVRVIDLYSIKPLDKEVILHAAKDTGGLLVIEDHYEWGGLGMAVSHLLSENNICTNFKHVGVRTEPHSAPPSQSLLFQGLSSEGIIKHIRNMINPQIIDFPADPE